MLSLHFYLHVALLNPSGFDSTAGHTFTFYDLSRKFSVILILPVSKRQMLPFKNQK